MKTQTAPPPVTLEPYELHPGYKSAHADAIRCSGRACSRYTAVTAAGNTPATADGIHAAHQAEFLDEMLAAAAEATAEQGDAGQQPLLKPFELPGVHGRVKRGSRHPILAAASGGQQPWTTLQTAPQ